ncbi:hypothetical protein CWD08_23770 [Salmonella enterica]|nr:hypothetical protein [Salmonella enterica]
MNASCSGMKNWYSITTRICYEKKTGLFPILVITAFKNGIIYYPLDEKEYSPEGIVAEVKKWRAENSKPGFKNG